MDPDLKEACAGDVEDFCSNVSPGQGQVCIEIRLHMYGVLTGSLGTPKILLCCEVDVDYLVCLR